MRPRDFLPPATPELRIRIVERAHDDIGEGENIGPDGRGHESERVRRSRESALRLATRLVLVRECRRRLVEGRRRALLPPNPGNCESWRSGRSRRIVPRQPQPGYAVLYGEPGHAHAHRHRRAARAGSHGAHGRRVLVIEGNTSLGQYNRDGWVVAEKIMDADAPDRLRRAAPGGSVSAPLVAIRGRAVPGIGLVIAGAAMVVAIASAATAVLRREEGLEERAAQADSVAREKTLEAVIARRTASADSARADSLERVAVRNDAAAAAARAELHALGDRAAAASARIDRTGSRPTSPTRSPRRLVPARRHAGAGTGLDRHRRVAHRR
jgi:hypothetical protein